MNVALWDTKLIVVFCVLRPPLAAKLEERDTQPSTNYSYSLYTIINHTSAPAYELPHLAHSLETPLRRKAEDQLTIAR